MSEKEKHNNERHPKTISCQHCNRVMPRQENPSHALKCIPALNHQIENLKLGIYVPNYKLKFSNAIFEQKLTIPTKRNFSNKIRSDQNKRTTYNSSSFTSRFRLIPFKILVSYRDYDNGQQAVWVGTGPILLTESSIDMEWRMEVYSSSNTKIIDEIFNHKFDRMSAQLWGHEKTGSLSGALRVVIKILSLEIIEIQTTEIREFILKPPTRQEFKSKGRNDALKYSYFFSRSESQYYRGVEIYGQFIARFYDNGKYDIGFYTYVAGSLVSVDMRWSVTLEDETGKLILANQYNRIIKKYNGWGDSEIKNLGSGRYKAIIYISHFEITK